MKSQKELKQQYAEILAADVWHKDQKMIDYCVKKAALIVELTNGDIVAIEKPEIKKNFCFGYSLSRYDTDDFDRANEMAEHASKSTKYFLGENLKDIDNMIERLEGKCSDYYCRSRQFYLVIGYTGQPEDSKFKQLTYRNKFDEESAGMTVLEGENLRRVIEGYKEVRAAFVKRLNTYLKRYGLSKVNTWSYWRDA